MNFITAGSLAPARCLHVVFAKPRHRAAAEDTQCCRQRKGSGLYSNTVQCSELLPSLLGASAVPGSLSTSVPQRH